MFPLFCSLGFVTLEKVASEAPERTFIKVTPVRRNEAGVIGFLIPAFTQTRLITYL